MLDLMRKNASTWLVKVLLGAIIIVFSFWGVGNYKARQMNTVATIDGHVITLENYKLSYNQLIERMSQQFGNALNDDMIKMLGIKKQALDKLIDEQLLLAEAGRLQFQISDSELVQAIQSVGAFQSGGVFNERVYRSVLERNRLTPQSFEAIQKRSMLLDRLKQFVLGSIVVSDLEAKEYYNHANVLVDIDHVVFTPESYKDIMPGDKEMSTFFESSKENYKTAPMVKAQYLYFNPDDYKETVSVSDEEILDYYESNPQEFITLETVEARHILVRADEGISSEADTAAKDKIQGYLDMARSGKDFAELATLFSEGPSKSKGGYLGTFKKGDMVKPFSDAAFSMDAGQISEPVRTRFGWHLIKVEKKNPASTLTHEAATETIRKKLTLQAAKTKAYDEAGATYDMTLEGDDLSRIASDREFTMKMTDSFTKQGPVKGIKNPAEFATAAFDLSIGDISDIINVNDGFAIIQTLEEFPARIPEFEDVKEKVRTDLVAKQQNERAQSDAQTLLTVLTQGKSLDEESKKFKLTPTSTGPFKRNAAIPEIGYERDIIEAAFQLSAKSPLPPDVLKGSKGYYVIRFKERIAPDEAGFENEKEKITATLMQQKMIKAYTALVEELKGKSEIVISDNFLE
jgi:peptidyl-prolyl cis-trans isomerase D